MSLPLSIHHNLNRAGVADVPNDDAAAGAPEARSRPAAAVEPNAIERKSARVERLDGSAGVWNADARRTLLLVASRFPPVASVGAIRIRKFVKYLGLHDWKPVVITGAVPEKRSSGHDARSAMDEDSLLDLPTGLPVHRLGPVSDDWPGHFSRAFAERLEPLTKWLGLDEPTLSAGLKWRLDRWHDRLAFPDRGIWRLPAAVKLALRLHRRYRFDAIFSSGMPFSDHMIALALRTILRRPWLADFRDPWAEYIHWRQWRSGWGRRFTHAAEAAVMRRATRVVSVNENMTRRFAERYPRVNRRKFVTISNGFDPADLEKHCERAPDEHFRLVYAGSLYGERSPEKVLAAFREFVRIVPGSARHARFEFLGRPGPHVDRLTDPSDGGTICYRGLLPHAGALRAMAEADLNVVVLPNMPGSAGDTTAKVYECLGSGRPILAAVPLGGSAADVLRPFDGVSLCDPDDVAGMVGAMTDWYGRWLSGTIEVERPRAVLRPLTRQNQTKKLAECLDESVTANRTGGGKLS